ncbi:HET-domain-containing protein [Trichoderma citrinoviride]|uniref:HET-domain-containing protein n=1 Tax=Trichoderma citrinoviride TaxID=58853 RepID=A0A2T4BJ08_9HYPO|nr:HET-domain-containing protein [Trichoderma citrinoviride]PTB69293.1 HET-domain-containing protein [Trichoderma citrinoviride]
MTSKVSWHDKILPPVNSSNSEIRILQIAPGPPSSPLQCNFRVTSLDNQDTPYEALSYAWGNDAPDSHESIFFGDTQVGVTPSLANALQRLRLPNETRNIWADALCINQADDVEKSLQVSMMGRIYRQCTQGAFWLGSLESTSPADAQAALDVLSWIAGEQDPPTWLADEGKRLAASAALKTLVNVSWWSRIWTVQEAILPPTATVYWGPCAIPWTILDKASESFFNGSAPAIHDEFWDNGCLLDLQAALRGLGASRGEELLQMLWRWRYRRATDPRDKVYGLLGFRSDIALPSVRRCDYTVDVRTLYQNVTVDLINMSTDLQPLIGRGGEGSDIPGLASWAIDWSGVEDPSRRSRANFWDHRHWWHFGGFTADRGMFGVGEGLRVEDNGDALRICGLKLGRVALVDEAAADDVPEKGPVASLFRAYGNRWGRLLSKYHTISPDGLSDGGMTAFLGLITGSLAADESDDEDDLKSWVTQMVRPQAIFITDNGQIGLGPPNVRPAQELWIIGGCRVPVILNPLPKASNQVSDPSLTFHSECFVYGVMQGEAVEGREDQVIDILLR